MTVEEIYRPALFSQWLLCTHAHHRGWAQATEFPAAGTEAERLYIQHSKLVAFLFMPHPLTQMP